MSVDRQPPLFGPLTVAPYTTTSSMVVVPGSIIDTGVYGQLWVSYQVQETGGVNGITAQVVGSFDKVNWNALDTYNAGGTLSASPAQAISASGTLVLIVSALGSSGFRFFAVQAEDTVGGSHGVAQVIGFSK